MRRLKICLLVACVLGVLQPTRASADERKDWRLDLWLWNQTLPDRDLVDSDGEKRIHPATKQDLTLTTFSSELWMTGSYRFLVGRMVLALGYKDIGGLPAEQEHDDFGLTFLRYEIGMKKVFPKQRFLIQFLVGAETPFWDDEAGAFNAGRDGNTSLILDSFLQKFWLKGRIRTWAGLQYFVRQGNDLHGNRFKSWPTITYNLLDQKLGLGAKSYIQLEEPRIDRNPKIGRVTNIAMVTFGPVITYQVTPNLRLYAHGGRTIHATSMSDGWGAQFRIFWHL